LSSKDRKTLLDFYGNVCNRCGSPHDLQADHRIGVALAGGADGKLEAFQALCRSCNLNKRVACGRCPLRDPVRCCDCSWAYPENAQHTAGQPGVSITLLLRPEVSPAKVRLLLQEHGLLLQSRIRLCGPPSPSSYKPSFGF
jgi:hypothetical protein